MKMYDNYICKHIEFLIDIGFFIGCSSTYSGLEKRR